MPFRSQIEILLGALHMLRYIIRENLVEYPCVDIFLDSQHARALMLVAVANREEKIAIEIFFKTTELNVFLFGLLCDNR